MSNNQEIYISVDVETSGPSPPDYSMLSLGACVVGNTSENFYAELKPISTNFLPQAMKVNGFSLEELLEKGEKPADAMQRFTAWLRRISWVKRESAVPLFVGFPLSFDWKFVDYYFWHFLGYNPFDYNGAIDVRSYFMGLKNKSFLESSREEIIKFFSPARKHTHNALDDAIEQAEIFEKMLART